MAAGSSGLWLDKLKERARRILTKTTQQQSHVAAITYTAGGRGSANASTTMSSKLRRAMRAVSCGAD